MLYSSSLLAQAVCRRTHCAQFLFEQFPCFTSTEVQILTPDEVRARCCISVVQAAEIASFQTVNISVGFFYTCVGIIEISGRCSCAESAEVAALVRRYLLWIIRGIIRGRCLLLSCAERSLTGSSSCTPRACCEAST